MSTTITTEIVAAQNAASIVPLQGISRTENEQTVKLFTEMGLSTVLDKGFSKPNLRKAIKANLEAQGLTGRELRNSVADKYREAMTALHKNLDALETEASRQGYTKEIGSVTKSGQFSVIHKPIAKRRMTLKQENEQLKARLAEIEAQMKAQG